MIYDERIDEVMKDSYDKAYLESFNYVCDCIDRVECSRCNSDDDDLGDEIKEWRE